MLLVSALAWSTSHFAFVRRISKLDLLLRIIGFVAFVMIFVLSGWKAGLVSIPIILLASIVGTVLAKR